MKTHFKLLRHPGEKDGAIGQSVASAESRISRVFRPRFFWEGKDFQNSLERDLSLSVCFRWQGEEADSFAGASVASQTPSPWLNRLPQRHEAPAAEGTHRDCSPQIQEQAASLRAAVSWAHYRALRAPPYALGRSQRNRQFRHDSGKHFARLFGRRFRL